MIRKCFEKFRNLLLHTFTMSAFPLPLIANKQTLALLINGYVMVTRSGGGFGESEIGAIKTLFSFSKA